MTKVQNLECLLPFSLYQSCQRRDLFISYYHQEFIEMPPKKAKKGKKGGDDDEEFWSVASGDKVLDLPPIDSTDSLGRQRKQH